MISCILPLLAIVIDIDSHYHTMMRAYYILADLSASIFDLYMPRHYYIPPFIFSPPA